MGLYAANGSFNVTVVSGAARTGLQAANGSYNVVSSDGSSRTGSHHACGAINVVVAASGVKSKHSPSGGWYVSETPFTNKGTPVTVVSGVL